MATRTSVAYPAGGGPDTAVRRTTSRSPSSATSGTFTSLRQAVGRALSPGGSGLGGSERRPSFGSKMSHLDDGRGRQPLVSTGRGGAGNIRSPSRGFEIESEVPVGIERGREVARDRSHDRVIHSGRGGAGNIRSPSRDPHTAVDEAREDALQARLVAEERGRQAEGNYSTGRGGAGNISRSKSRSRSAVRDPAASARESSRTRAGYEASPHRPPHGAVVHGGRGGWGNISEEHERTSIDEEKEKAAREYEAGIRAKHQEEDRGKVHSSGKGGAGNMVTGPPGVDMSQLTLEEREAYAKVHANDRLHGHSSGRGGGGNFFPATEERGRGDKKEHGVLGSVFRSLSRATGREKD